MFRPTLLVVTAALVLAAATLDADVTIVTTMAIEGGAQDMMGTQQPRMIMRIKGMKSATEIDGAGQSIATLVDLETRRVVVLNGRDRSARVLDGSTAATGRGNAAPQLDVTLTPTGRTRTIQGQECREYAYTVTTGASALLSGANVAPETAAMFKGVSLKMDGSTWSAQAGPGAAEYTAYMKAAVEHNIMAAMASSLPGLSVGLEQILGAAMRAPGIPYLTEMTMTVEGTGEMVKMLQKMAAMTIRMEVASVSTDPIPDSFFEIPAGYKTTK